MKNILSILLIISTISAYSQQATEIDPKSITLPRYSNLTAITTALSSPKKGMLVYNDATATNWFYNGSTWVNLAMATASPVEPEGFGSWGCEQAALMAYQPVGNLEGKNFDNFGSSVALSGDYAIVGANLDDEGGLTDNGSASIYKRNSSTSAWDFQTKLTNPSAANADYFGISIALSGDYAIVGAYIDNEGGFSDNGSASIYKRNSSTGAWDLQTKLTNPSAADFDNFGWSVALSGDYVIVGANLDDEGGFTNNGSASIYKRNSSTGAWDFQTKLTNPSAANSDNFGWSVALSGDYVILGANLDDEGGLTDNGSASIYKRNSSNGAWDFQTKLTNLSAANSDRFGSSVALSGDYAIVGAIYDDEGGFTDSGSASIYKRNSSTGAWDLQTKLTNPSAANSDYFGRSVALSGDYAIVGTNVDDEGGFINNGSASIYKRVGEVWTLVSKTTYPGAKRDNSYFGISVSIDSIGRFLVGAFGEDNNKGIAVFGKVR